MKALLPTLIAMALLAACSPRNGLVPPEAADDDDSAVGPGCPLENNWPEQLPEYASYAGTGAAAGDLVYDFVLTDQLDQRFCLSQFFGSAVILDFSTRWCGPCNEAAAESMELWDEMLAIGPSWFATVMTQNLSGGPATDADTQWWAETYGLEYPVGLDASEEVADRFGVTGYPLFLFIAPNGEVVARHENKPTDSQVLDFVEQAVEEYADSLRP